MPVLPKINRTRKKELKELEKKLGVRFRKIGHLEWALQHRSYVNEFSEKKLSNNERLEFFGDSVLGLVMAQYLFEKFPQFPEGKLSMLKSSLVNQDKLAALAKQFNLGQYLLLGKGENKGGGRNRPSILSDAFEAMVAALYLDRGYKAVYKFLITLYKREIDDFMERKGNLDNAKNRLQKVTQSRFGLLPQYHIQSETGPQHRKIFEVSVFIHGQLYGEGKGPTKKKAEEEAALNALKGLKSKSP